MRSWCARTAPRCCISIATSSTTVRGNAFRMLKEKGLAVRRPDCTFATPDHYVPTLSHDLASIQEPNRRGVVARARRRRRPGIPTRPVTLVIPFPPGGGNDALGRLVADKSRHGRVVRAAVNVEARTRGGRVMHDTASDRIPMLRMLPSVIGGPGCDLIGYPTWTASIEIEPPSTPSTGKHTFSRCWPVAST